MRSISAPLACIGKFSKVRGLQPALIRTCQPNTEKRLLWSMAWSTADCDHFQNVG